MCVFRLCVFCMCDVCLSVCVSFCHRYDSGGHVVTLFDADTRALLRTLGGACGSRPGLLKRPAGVRISVDERTVVVSVRRRC